MSEPLHGPAAVFEQMWQSSEKECVELRAEIERLQAALREIVTTDPPQSSNDWFQEWKTLAFRLKSIARRELELGG